ncbi:MAG: hypothetical protein JWN78_225 [Bacteroidota bacterium]|nr:hypothetical protein [Bacteroidota bacterium]
MSSSLKNGMLLIILGIILLIYIIRRNKLKGYVWYYDMQVYLGGITCIIVGLFIVISELIRK